MLVYMRQRSDIRRRNPSRIDKMYRTRALGSEGAVADRKTLRRASLIAASALVGLAGGYALNSQARGASVSCGPVVAGNGFKNCVIVSSPESIAGVNKISPNGSPYRHRIWNMTLNLSWGPWQRTGGSLYYVIRQPSWNWFGSVVHQVDNTQAGTNGTYYVSID